MSNSFSIIVLITCLRSTTTHNYSGPVWFIFFITHQSSLNFRHFLFKNTPIFYNFVWWVVWVEYLSGFFNSSTHLYITHWVPQKSIANQVYRTVTKPTRVVSPSPPHSLSTTKHTVPNFRNPHTTA